MKFQKNKILFNFLILITLLQTTACSIKIGPDFVLPLPTTREPIVRVGEITESLTGSWAQPPARTPSGFRGEVVQAFKEREFASRLSSSSSNLTMNIELVSDHEDDAQRLANLGGLSLITLGIIPLNYFSEWNVDCNVTLVAPDGAKVADYVFQERGTYSIWVMPLTMFTLSGAGIRGDADARRIYQKVATSLAVKIVDAIDKDYDKLGAKAGMKKVTPEEPSPELPKPLIM